jgi:hypothetical protein
MVKKPPSTKPQIQSFRETARALECDESQERFDAVLGKVARNAAPTQVEADPSKRKKPRK